MSKGERMSASDDRFYIGSVATSLNTDENRVRLVQRLRQYLEVRNLTVLVGNGSSIPLGAPLVGSTRKIVSELDTARHRLSQAQEHQRARSLLDHVLSVQPDIGVEPLLTVLVNIQANDALLGTDQIIGGSKVTAEDALLLERLLKKWLYHRCEDLNRVPDERLRDQEELLRRLLLRSTTLPRAKVFTTNYDVVLERALDNLGVMYFDGFLGTINRTLRTESYHYDLYYPGETTEGRVSRVDRVLHLYKLHGSINWRRRRTGPDDIVISHVQPAEGEYGDVMIYPSPLKVTEMNGYPYAEMFRHFSTTIHQPQSALLTIGYKFQDDHINRLIYQALSIPSFTLIIVIPSISEPADVKKLESAHEIWRLINRVKSNRVVVITGGKADVGSGQYTSGAGTVSEFSSVWLPDIRELNVEANAREETRKALKPLSPIADEDHEH
jgi:SIR2-like domain